LAGLRAPGSTPEVSKVEGSIEQLAMGFFARYARQAGVQVDPEKRRGSGSDDSESNSLASSCYSKRPLKYSLIAASELSATTHWPG
jgi:hypothetical protein